MFKGIERMGKTVNLMSASVRVKRTDFKIIPSLATNGTYTILILKNGKFFSERKTNIKTINGINKAVQAEVNFYNTGNRAKVLGEIGKVEVEKEKASQKRIKIRDNRIKAEIENRIKLREEASKKKKYPPYVSKSLQGILMSMGAVK